jgi:hypothetical protein
MMAVLGGGRPTAGMKMVEFWRLSLVRGDQWVGLSSYLWWEFE